MTRSRRVSLGLVLALLLGSFLLVPAAAPAAPPQPGAGAPDGGPPLDPAPPASPAGHLYPWKGTPTDVPGQSTYNEGEFILTDNPFDDHGANTDVTNDREQNPTEYYTLLEGANAATVAYGDYKYPSDAVYGQNAADIVELRLAADADAWYVLVILNTLIDPERTAIEAKLDDHVLLAHGQSATFDGHPVDAVADAAQNTFEVRIPRAPGWDPGHGKRSLFVASGLWDVARADWVYPVTPPPLPPQLQTHYPPYFDLAYARREGMDSYWRERAQAGDLASNDLSSDVVEVDFGILSCSGDGCPQRAPLSPRGLLSRVFRSGQPLGEGVVPQTRYGQDTSFPYKLYRSRYQPYALYVAPRRGDGPQPLVLLMHFLAGNYMSYPITSWPAMKTWADSLGAIVAMPLGRGEAGWYEAEAEKDVFEVWRDVAQHYDVDRERVYLSGMSMGGYGTWRLGLLYPDLFAKAIVWSGPMTPYSIWPYPAPVTWPYPNPPGCDRDAPGCGFTLMDLFGNAHNLPYLVIHGGLDELVPSTGAEHWMDEYARAGGTYRYVLYPDRKHETSYPGTTAHWVSEWLGDLRERERDPVHVSYTLVADLFQPELGISYDGSYWVDGMLLAEGARDGSIDAAVGNVTGESVKRDAGADLLGPWVERGRMLVHGPLGDNTLYVTARSLARATIDTRRIGWNPAETHHVSGKTDADLSLRLSGDFPESVSITGAAFTRDGSDIVLSLPAGSFDVTIG